MPYIAVVALPGSFLSSVGAALDAHTRLSEIFATDCNLAAHARMQTGVKLLSLDGRDVQLAGNRQLAADAAISTDENICMIFLSAFQLIDPERATRDLQSLGELHGWLAYHAARGVRIAASGTSALHVALARLLENGEASVPDRIVPLFHRLFPRIALRPSDSMSSFRNITTCGAGWLAMDLAVKVLGDVFSLETARGIAQHADLTRAGYGLSPAIGDSLVAQAQFWIREHFTQTFRIRDLAIRLSVTHQTLTRRFYEETGESPRDFAQRLRMESAAVMLRHTNRRISEVATLAGYSDPTSFRVAFQSRMGCTPSSYRHRL
jgi:transcriptional regulator GlxA family with amidase domain